MVLKFILVKTFLQAGYSKTIEIFTTVSFRFSVSYRPSHLLRNDNIKRAPKYFGSFRGTELHQCTKTNFSKLYSSDLSLLGESENPYEHDGCLDPDFLFRNTNKYKNTLEISKGI
jgi:hypothetical protein